jgi:hypothetical protein
MPFSDIFQELWSETAFQEFISTANIAALTNRSFEGTASRRGDTVHVHYFDPASLTVRTTWESGAADTDFGAVKTINIDQTPSINVEIMSIDQLLTNADLQRETATAIGKRLANYVDGKIITAVSGSASSLAITSYDTLVDARAVLTQNGVPADDLWFAATSTQYKNLLKDDDVNRSTVAQGNNQVVTGEVRRIAGVNVFEQTVDSLSGILFHRSALAFVSPGAVRFEIDSMLGGQKKFGNVLGAGMLFGVGVLSTNAVRRVSNT